MAILIPSAENLRSLKSVLMSDFGFGSSHASEAIAALLGFNSNSGFRSSEIFDAKDYVCSVDFDTFTARAMSFGIAEAAYLPDMWRAIDFPLRPWCQLKKTDHIGRDRWFSECQARKVPFMIVSKARKYCTFEWDHISADQFYDKLAQRAFDGELGRLLFRTYQMTCGGLEKKSFFEGSVSVGEIRGLSEAGARIVANSFSQLLYPANLRAI